jgi:hypothetical protein
VARASVAVAPPVGRVILVAAGLGRSGRVLLAGLPGRTVVAVPGRRAVVAMPGGRSVIVVRVPEIGRPVSMIGMGRARWHVVLLVAEGKAGRSPVALVLARQPRRDVIPVPACETVVVPMAMLEARDRRGETR